MDRFRGNIVTRLLAGIAFGVLFLAGGFYFATKFLTPDLMIRQRLHFKIPESHRERFATQWAAFAQEQQVQLLHLAEQTLPYLDRYVSVIPRSDVPIITLRLRCSPDADINITKQFNNLVASYIAQRTAMEQSDIATSSDAVFNARLDLSENDISKSKPFSRFQQFVLVVFALAGFLVGIGPPGGYLPSQEEESEETPREICRSVTSPSRELTLLSSTTFDTTTATQAVVTIPKKKTHREPEQADLPVVERITVDEAEIETLPLARPEKKDNIKEEESEVEAVREHKISEEFPEESTEPVSENQSEEIFDEESELIFQEEEMENHSRQQEILLSEIVIPSKKKDIDSTENIPDDSAKAEIEPEPEPVEPEPDTANIEPIPASKPQTEPSQEPVLSESEESKVAQDQETIPVVAIDLNKDMPSAQAAGTAGGTRSQYDKLADLVEKLRPQIRCPVIAISALKPKDISPRLTVNLAVTLIRRALRVLIVEADPSSKELATLFGLPEKPGFFEWRRGAAWISHTTHRTQLVGLSVMPAGIPNEQQENPDLELWREKHRWGNLSNDFDVVLLYYPSALSEDPQTPEQIMGVHLRDMASGFLALTRSTKQIEKTAQTVVDNLAEHNAQLLAILPIKA